MSRGRQHHRVTVGASGVSGVSLAHGRLERVVRQLYVCPDAVADSIGHEQSVSYTASGPVSIDL